MNPEVGEALAGSAAGFAAEWCGFLVGETLFVHDCSKKAVLQVDATVVPWLILTKSGGEQRMLDMLRPRRAK